MARTTRTPASPSAEGGRALRRPTVARMRRRERARRAHADIAEVLLTGVVVITIVTFLGNGRGPALHIGTFQQVLAAWARLTGLLGTALLLVQLQLSARVPWLDRIYGQDRALLAHRRLSQVALPLVLAHATAATVAYGVPAGGTWTAWLLAPVRLLAPISSRVPPLPHLVTAAAAMTLLVLVAGSSMGAARRRCSHETWHLVHLCGYLAVALAVPHELIGPDIGPHPWAQVWWAGLYLTTVGVVLCFRVLLPAWRSVRHGLVVSEVVREAPGVVSLVVRGRHLDRLPVQAGQFLHWRFLARGLWATSHPWSLSAAPDGRHLRLTVRDLGNHSGRLGRVRPGTRVLIEGPYGAFTTARRTRKRVLLIAAGIGVTPILAIAQELAATTGVTPGHVTVLYRGSSDASLVLLPELEQLAASSGIRLQVLVGRSGAASWLPAGLAGRNARADAQALASLVPYLRHHDVFLCGPGPWMHLVRQTLRAAKIPASQVHDERFSW